MRTLVLALSLAPLALSAGLVGCSKKAKYVDPDAESRVEGTGIEARDLRAVAAQMTSDLVASPALAEQPVAPRIAVLPVENRSRFLIDASILTTLLTDEIISTSGGRLAIVNRDLVDQILKERDMKARGEVSDDGQVQALAGVDWFLEGSVESLSASTNRAQTDYVVIRFQLTNAESSVVSWSNRYEMKKEGSWGVMYQ
jgi:PBP1b-binding outer membrane lipoprotein LpoB